MAALLNGPLSAFTQSSVLKSHHKPGMDAHVPRFACRRTFRGTDSRTNKSIGLSSLPAGLFSETNMVRCRRLGVLSG